MGRVLVAALLLVGQTASPRVEDTARLLRELFRESDRIVEAEVVAIRTIPREKRRGGRDHVGLAELRTATTLWGDPESTLMIVTTEEYLLRREPLQIGDRVIGFLRSSRFDPTEVETARRLASVSGRAGPQEFVGQGAGCIRILGPADHPKAFVAGQGQGELDSLRSWIQQAIAAETPAIEIQVVSNGPCSPVRRVIVWPNGEGQVEDCMAIPKPTKFLLPGDEIRRIHAVIAAEDLEVLPQRVGHSFGPDSAIGILTIRGARRARTVRFLGPPDRRSDSSESLAEHEQVLRIWAAIPHAREWTIDGR